MVRNGTVGAVRRDFVWGVRCDTVNSYSALRRNAVQYLRCGGVRFDTVQCDGVQ